MSTLIPQEIIENKIFLIRGKKVMLDCDLAQLYDVPTKSLNLAVKRNKERFPVDFMFQVTNDELKSLRFQFETSKRQRGGRRYLPYSFTEQGVAMLSSVLRSPRAVQVNIAIMRAFVKLRELMITHKELAEKMRDLERKYRGHDDKFETVFRVIRQLLVQEQKPKKKIGFHA